MEISEKDLNFSPYWASASWKLRRALDQLPEDGVPKKYPVSSSNDKRALVIGGVNPDGVSYETGVLSLTAEESGIHVVRLAFESPISEIELRGITVSDKPIAYPLKEKLAALVFYYTNLRTGLFGVDANEQTREIFGRRLTGAFATLALTRALHLG